MALSLVTAPTAEPLVWANQAQKQLRLDGIDDDQVFVENTLIPAVRQRGETATRRQFITATWKLLLDRFPGMWLLDINDPLTLGYGFCRRFGWSIVLPKPPLKVDSVSITYLDTNGVSQTLASTVYVVDAPQGPKCQCGRIALAYGQVWPATLPQVNAVTVNFQAGYGASGASVPPQLLQAMLLDLGTLYENREDVLIDPRVTASVELSSGCQQTYRSFKSHGSPY